jgi:hypothetical protein
MIGFFEGLDRERRIAWRVVDSFTLAPVPVDWLGESRPDHVTISRTRWLMMQRRTSKSSVG